MAQGHHLHLRLFLEGIEVPVVAATVNCAANSPATASIQVVATDAVMDLLPRTVVHLFYYDYINASPLSVLESGEFSQGDDDFNRMYSLLFMGELTAFQFQKSSDQRAVVLQCVDFSNYWDTTFQYNFNGSLFGGRRHAAFIGANTNLFNSPLGHGYGTVSHLLNGKSVNFPELRGLLAGVVRMLEAIGGSYYGKTTFRGANDFTSVAELRLKILQQIVAAEADTSTAQLFSRKAFNLWMNKVIGSLGQLVSFRSLLQVLFQFVFHEVYACPVAKYVDSYERTARASYSVGLGKIRKFGGFFKLVSTALNWAITAQNSFAKWRQFIGTGRSRRELSAASTEFVQGLMGTERYVNDAYALGSTVGVPAQAFKDMACAHDEVQQIRGLAVGSGGYISANHTMGKGSLDEHGAAINAKLARVELHLRAVLATRVAQSRSYKEQTSTRVNNQLFRPDIFYAPPPRCNVLFPEMYDSFSFSRQFLREVTRMELVTHNEILGSHELFNGRYYAPDIEDVRKGARLSTQQFCRVLMEHELFTGIIPMFETMTEANLYAMRSGKVNKGGAKVSFAQQAVNFQYFKYRFESRGMSAAGRFNPLFVPGFPALIIDKRLDKQSLDISAMDTADQLKALSLSVEEPLSRAQVLQLLVSPQYLGVCAALTHSLSQQGGRTSYNFMQARLHRESAEYLGVDKVTVVRNKASAQRTTIVAAPAEDPPKKGMAGIKGGTITRVREVTSSYKGRTLALFGSVEKVQVGSRVPVLSDKPVTGKTATQKQATVLIKAFAIQETVPLRIRDKVDLPIEEAIRQPWVWEGWANPKISETYAQFFGTGAVTDVSGYDVVNQTAQFLGADDAEALRAQRGATATKEGSYSAVVRRDARSQAIAENKRYQLGLRMLEQERTVENSIDFLVRAYSFVRENNLDVGDFLRAYGYRPVATMVDILGSSDFSIQKTTSKRTLIIRRRYVRGHRVLSAFTPVDANGEPLLQTSETFLEPIYGTVFVRRTVSKTSYTTTGTEGFHSRAFGDEEDLFGLVSPTVTTVLNLSQDRRKVAAQLDVRKRRRAKVRAYVEELMRTKGLMG